MRWKDSDNKAGDSLQGSSERWQEGLWLAQCCPGWEASWRRRHPGPVGSPVGTVWPTAEPLPGAGERGRREGRALTIPDHSALTPTRRVTQSSTVARPPASDRPASASPWPPPGKRRSSGGKAAAKVSEGGAWLGSRRLRRWAWAASSRTPASCREKPPQVSFWALRHGAPDPCGGF